MAYKYVGELFIFSARHCTSLFTKGGLPKTSLAQLGVRLKMHELTVSSETFESECKLCLISNAILGGKKNRPRQPLKANLFFSIPL